MWYASLITKLKKPRTVMTILKSTIPIPPILYQGLLTNFIIRHVVSIEISI